MESLTNQEEVELRAKIETLGLEVRKLPSKSAQHLNEVDGYSILMLQLAFHLVNTSLFKDYRFAQLDGDSNRIGQVICKARPC